MNIIYKLSSFLVLVFSCFLCSCDFSDSFVEKIKDHTTNSEEFIDDEDQETYVVNEEQLDSISQNLSLLEHRVYYIDCSGSMISRRFGNKYDDGSTLLDKVKESLESSLLDLDVDSVDIDIIPFYGKEWNNGILQAKTIRKRGSYTSTNKEGIHNAISSISVPEGSNSWHTHHYYPINDFLDNRISNKKQYHIMILLTDGKDEYNEYNQQHPKDKVQPGTEVLQTKWFSLCKEKKIFGIFNDLKGDIKGALPDMFKANKQKNLFWIEGVNFNINIFQLSNTADEVLLRKDSLIRIPFGGNLPKSINLATNEDKHYKYEVCQPEKNDKYLKIKVSALHDGKLPDETTSILRFVYNWGEQKTNTYNFPDEETVAIKIVDEKTPKLELYEADAKFKKGALSKRHLSYYKKWFSMGGEHSDTTTLSLAYSYSTDVTNDSSIKHGSIKIEGLPEYVRILDSQNKDITDKGIILPKSQNDTISLKLTLTPGSDLLEGNKVDSATIQFVDVENYNTIKWNGKKIEKTNGKYIAHAIILQSHEEMNPLKEFLLWILISLLLLLLLALISIWLYFEYRKHHSPKFLQNYQISFRGRDNVRLLPNSTNSIYKETAESPIVKKVKIYTLQVLKKIPFLNKFLWYDYEKTTFCKENVLIWNTGNEIRTHVLSNSFVKYIAVYNKNCYKSAEDFQHKEGISQTWFSKHRDGRIIIADCDYNKISSEVDSIYFIPQHDNNGKMSLKIDIKGRNNTEFNPIENIPVSDFEEGRLDNMDYPISNTDIKITISKP